MTALATARQLLAKWSAEQVLDTFMRQLDERLPGSILRQTVMQATLRNIDLYRSLLELVADGRGSVATMLTRPQLETAAHITWIAMPTVQDEQVRRITRLVVAGIRDTQERYPAWRPDSAYVELLEEADRDGLRDLPTARNAMQQIDHQRRRNGEPAFFDSHYSQFQLASSHLHSMLFGPASFLGSSEGPLRWSDSHNVLLTRAAHHYGTQYFVLTWQGLWTLVGEFSLTHLLEADGRPVVDLADQELLEVARPTSDGWAPR